MLIIYAPENNHWMRVEVDRQDLSKVGRAPDCGQNQIDKDAHTPPLWASLSRPLERVSDPLENSIERHLRRSKLFKLALA